MMTSPCANEELRLEEATGAFEKLKAKFDDTFADVKFLDEDDMSEGERKLLHKMYELYEAMERAEQELARCREEN